MSMRRTAPLILASLLLSCVSFADERDDASPQNEPSAAAPATSDSSTAAPSDASAAPAGEMSADEAAQAAQEGKIDYAEEKVDPHKATAAEIAAHNATASADDKIVCRMEQLTGSHRRVKVCMTVAQRREMTERTQDELSTAGRDSSGPLRGN